MRHLLRAGARSFVLTELMVWWKRAAWKQQLQYSEQETQRRKASQRSTKREPERKRYKEKPGGAEKEEGGSEDTRKRLERERERGIHRRATCTHAYTSTSAVHEYRRCPSQQTQSFLLWEWGLGISKRSPAGAQQPQVGEEPGPDEGKQGLQMCGQMTGRW